MPLSDPQGLLEINFSGRRAVEPETASKVDQRRVDSRPLEFFEKVLHVGNQHSALQMTRTLLLEGALDVGLLEESLRAIRDRIPLLQATIRTHFCGERLVWSPELPAPQLRILPRVGQDAWQKVAAAEVHHKFEEGQSLWRPLVLQNQEQKRAELVVTFHHAVCDGISANLFMRWVLEAYAALQNGTSLDGIVPPQRLVGIRPYDRSWFAGAVATFTFCGRLARQMWAERAVGRMPHQCVEPVAVAQRRTSPWFIAFDDQLSRKLQQRSRREGATVQGAFCAAMLLAAQGQFSKIPPALTCFSNIDLRRHGRSDSTEQFGCSAYFVVTEHQPVEAGSFWEGARAATARIAAQIVAAGRPPSHWIAPLAGVWLKRFMQSSRMGRTQTVGVSNLGRVHLPGTVGNLVVRGMYSLTGQHGIGPDAMLLAATVNDRLSATLCFVEPLLDRERQASFVRNFRVNLEAACDEIA